MRLTASAQLRSPWRTGLVGDMRAWPTKTHSGWRLMTRFSATGREQLTLVLTASRSLTAATKSSGITSTRVAG